MTIIIVGSEGNVGHRLAAALPDVIGIDQAPGADIVADLATVDYQSDELQTALTAAGAVVHLATSANPEAPDDVHWQAVANTARLVAACERAGVPRIVLPSSDWAEPKPGMPAINAYGWSKRAMEVFAEMYSQGPGRVGVAVRIGWVPHSVEEVAPAAAWLRANYWDDDRLVAEFRRALGMA